MIVWGSSLKHTLWSPNCYLTFELIVAREYEHVCWRGEAFWSEVALLWTGKACEAKEALAAADRLSHWVVLLVLWQEVVICAPTELNSSVSTEGIDVPEDLTVTVTTEWVIQGSSCWTILNISLRYSACIPRLGLHFSVSQEKSSIIGFFYFVFSSPRTPLYNESNVEKLLQVATEDPVNK